jgi:Uma2 family endonuclease
MATATLPKSDAETPSGPAPGLPYRLSADDYFRMVENDIIPADRRVGLWEGQLYEKMARKLPHSGASSKAAHTLIRVLPAGWCFWPENPILIDDFTAPLPDAALVRGTPDDYTRRGSNPKAEEIGLVIEIADSSLRKNLTRTLETYARAGLPVYWVVNLADRRVEVFSQPRPAGDSAAYAAGEAYGPGTEVPLVLDGREVARIPVSELLPAETP